MPPGIASGAHKPMGFQGAKRRNDGKSVRRKAVDMGTRCDIIEAYRCIKRDREREREKENEEKEEKEGKGGWARHGTFSSKFHMWFPCATQQKSRDTTRAQAHAPQRPSRGTLEKFPPGPPELDGGSCKSAQSSMVGIDSLPPQPPIGWY